MKNIDFLDGIKMVDVDWNQIDTNSIPEDCDQTEVDLEFEQYITDVLDIVKTTEDEIRRKCKLLNEGIFNNMKKKAPRLIKIDDDVVYNKVIDSTIKYKITHNFNDLYSLYRKLGDKDIRKICYVEIHALYVHQIRKNIANANKLTKQERNKKIFDLIDEGVKYAEIAAKFALSEISIKKLAQKYKKNVKESEI